MRWVSDGAESPEFPTDSTGRRYFGNSFLVAPPSPDLDFIVDQRLTLSKSPPYLEYLAVLNTSHHGDKASFTLFPVLPPELRVKVWRMSMENRYRLLNIHIIDLTSYAVLHPPTRYSWQGNQRPTSVRCYGLRLLYKQQAAIREQRVTG